MQTFLLAHPRSGSSSLFKILQLHPALNLLEEPFNENFSQWENGNKDYRSLVHDRASLDEQLAEMFVAHNGLKLLDYQLPDKLLAHLLARDGCRFIFLRRRNLLQSVVSVLIAHQTQLWKKWEMDKPLLEYYRQMEPLDVADVQARVEELKRHLDYLEGVLDRRACGTVFKLDYEGLYDCSFGEQVQVIEKVWAFLGLESIEAEEMKRYLRPKKAKINSPTTYNLLPNAQEIDARCGNDTTGWLFPR